MGGHNSEGVSQEGKAKGEHDGRALVEWYGNWASEEHVGSMGKGTVGERKRKRDDSIVKPAQYFSSRSKELRDQRWRYKLTVGQLHYVPTLTGGASWGSSLEQARSASRLAMDSNTSNARLGFRVVREL